jgi:glycosyltransferase involved in cell wall biosynthesis
MKYIDKISVVMAVYKNDNDLFFKEAVKSLLQQTYLPSEIIIVVDGYVNTNIDDVLHQLASNNLIKIIKLPENKGLANALNVGIKSAKYDLIARMDADDICFPDRFEKQIEYIIKENLDIVGGQIIEFGIDIQDVISERKVPLNHADIIDFMKLRSPLSHPSIIFRKELFNSIDGYDVNLFPLDDYDFFVRAYLKGFKFGNVKDNILWFRLGSQAEAITRRHGILYAKNEFKMFKKFLKMGFYNYSEFFKVVLLKIPLRVIPFPVFKFIYYKYFR